MRCWYFHGFETKASRESVDRHWRLILVPQCEIRNNISILKIWKWRCHTYSHEEMYLDFIKYVFKDFNYWPLRKGSMVKNRKTWQRLRAKRINALYCIKMKSGNRGYYRYKFSLLACILSTEALLGGVCAPCSLRHFTPFSLLPSIFRCSLLFTNFHCSFFISLKEKAQQHKG